MKNVHEKLQALAYDVTRPAKPSSTCNCGTKFKEDTNFCSHCGEPVGVNYKLAMDEYNKSKRNYEVDVSNKRREFKHDALSNAGLDKHPRADDIFEFVQETKDYYSEQVDMLEDLAELFLQGN
jgi:predicted amidophosphoribosyltransferase